MFQLEGGGESNPTNGLVRAACVEVVSCVQSKLSCTLHAPRGAKLLEDLRKQDSSTTKKAMAREKGAMALVGCTVISQEDTMDAPLWRDTLGRRLVLHDAVERSVECAWL